MRKLLLGLAIALGIPTLGYAQSVPEWSIWKNQRGSILVITSVQPDGSFIGSFLNNASGYRCRGLSTAISGASQGSTVTFVTNFAPCDNTITVWKGVLNGDVLQTNFDLMYVDGSYNFKEIKDQDVFNRVK